jgi:uncharacterized membrane protein
MPTSPWDAACRHSRRRAVGRRAACLALAALAVGGCEQQAEERQTAADADIVANAGPAPVAAADPATGAAEPAAAVENDATATVPAPAARKPWSPSGYTLSGTEPFWGGTVSGSRIVYQTPEDQAGRSIPATAELADSRETYAGRLNGKPFRLTLTKGTCSNGMSDRAFAFKATLSVAGETRQGCADPK